MIYRKTYFTPNSVTFTNPADFADTAKASVVRKEKNIGPNKLTNVQGEFTINRRIQLPAPPNCVDECLPIYKEDVRAGFTFSGSTTNVVALRQVRDDLISLVHLWFDDAVAGFTPDAAPNLPAVQES